MDGGCVNSDLEIVTHRIKQSNVQWAARHSRFSKCPATLLKYSLSIWRLITSQLCQCKGIKRSDSASKPNVRPDWEVLRLRQQVRQNALVCHFDAHEYNMDYSLYSFCDWSQACFIFSSGNSNFQSYLIRTEKFYPFLCGFHIGVIPQLWGLSQKSQLWEKERTENCASVAP